MATSPPPREPAQDPRPLDSGASPLGHAVQAAILAPDPVVALEALATRGDLLARALPEVLALRALTPPAGQHHKDLWDHTLRVVAQSPPRLVVRWAALLHDIGKAATRRMSPEGGVTFSGHAEVGARMVEDSVSSRLGFGVGLRIAVVSIVRHHQRAAAYDPAWTDSAVRRLGRELGAHMRDLLDLSRADVTSGIPGRREAALARIDELATRWEEIQAADTRPAPLPKGIGRAIMERFRLPPGPEVGVLRARLIEAMEAGGLPREATPEQCLRWLGSLLPSEDEICDGTAPWER